MAKPSSLPIRFTSESFQAELSALVEASLADLGEDQGLRARVAAAAPALERFGAEVVRWGQKTDLVAAATMRALVEILCQDALALALALSELGARSFIDVGAGAGAPAIPLALLLPELEGRLLEPRRRRVAFMRSALGTLGLGGRIAVEEGRLADELELARPEVSSASPHGAPFDVAFSRATFAPEEWARRGSALAPQVAILLGRADLEGERHVLWRRDYRVPSTGASRSLLVIAANT